MPDGLFVLTVDKLGGWFLAAARFFFSQGRAFREAQGWGVSEPASCAEGCSFTAARPGFLPGAGGCRGMVADQACAGIGSISKRR